MLETISEMVQNAQSLTMTHKCSIKDAPLFTHPAHIIKFTLLVTRVGLEVLHHVLSYQRTGQHRRERCGCEDSEDGGKGTRGGEGGGNREAAECLQE